jgi:hypothetical protein
MKKNSFRRGKRATWPIKGVQHAFNPNSQLTRGKSHPFTLKKDHEPKKNYENSNISPCKNIIFKTIL